jgi:hypothetical protein
VSRVALRDGLFAMSDDAGGSRLLASRCTACQRHNFPVQDSCPYCGDEKCVTVELSPRGVVEVCTTVVNRPPGYEGPLPFGFGVVELPEGIRIISRIRQPQRAMPGTAVRLVLDSIGADAAGVDVVTYAFEPET